MTTLHRAAAMLLTATLVLASACGGDDGGDDESTPASGTTPAASRTATSGATPADGATTAAGSTPGAAATASSSCGANTPASSGGAATPEGITLTAEDATRIMSSVLLTPEDLPGSDWTIMSDTTNDNVDAAQARPELAASNERCGRLLGRTVIHQPADVLNAFIGGETLSFFSTATVYATDAGAIDCANEAAQRLAAPGALAKEFGGLFVNPDAVSVAINDFPTEIEGAFSATLTGDIIAAGTTIRLTLLIVAWRDGAVSAVVGSARSGSTPPNDELRPLAELVAQRIADAQ